MSKKSRRVAKRLKNKLDQRWGHRVEFADGMKYKLIDLRVSADIPKFTEKETPPPEPTLFGSTTMKKYFNDVMDGFIWRMYAPTPEIQEAQEKYARLMRESNELTEYFKEAMQRKQNEMNDTLHEIERLKKADCEKGQATHPKEEVVRFIYNTPV